MAEDTRSIVERLAALLVAGSSLVLALTCAGTGPLLPGRAGSESASSPSSPSLPSAAPKVPLAPASIASRPPPATSPFEHSHRALSDLARGRRTAAVRVLWLGDSHAAADYWPDAFRRRLGERYGNGGPGFVRVGVVPYRHAKVVEKLTGRWAREPGNPARCSRFGDGVFGIAGMRVRPQSGEGTTRIELNPGATRGGTRWELTYRLLDRGARFRVALDGAPPRPIGAGDGVDGSATLEHLELLGSIDGSLRLDGFEGTTELMGVTIESTKPGVVVDTVGIDGARAATPLAWDERSWVEEVRHRNPTLAVVAFGTNEVLAPDPPERYGAELGRIVERLRQGVVELDCLLVGPTPLETHDRTTNPRVAEIDRVEGQMARSLGCGYFSPYQAMGGEGGYARWSAESPSLTAHDRVHLSPAGYARLGDLMADQLLDGLGEAEP